MGQLPPRKHQQARSRAPGIEPDAPPKPVALPVAGQKHVDARGAAWKDQCRDRGAAFDVIGKSPPAPPHRHLFLLLGIEKRRYRRPVAGSRAKDQIVDATDHTEENQQQQPGQRQFLPIEIMGPHAGGPCSDVTAVEDTAIAGMSARPIWYSAVVQPTKAT